MSNAIGNHGVNHASFLSTTGTGHAQASQNATATGLLNGQSATIAPAGGPATTGPGPLVAGLKSFGKLLATPALAIASKIDAHKAAKAAVIAQATTARDNLRTELGTPGQHSILNEQLSFPDPNNPGATITKSIGELMVGDQHGQGGYLQSLKAGGTIPGTNIAVHETYCNADPNEVKTWIAMGEKIVKQLETNQALPPGSGLTITVPNSGQPPRQVNVPANLDTTRAITWFLTAQAMKDNYLTDTTKPLTVGSGTFIHKDPGNKIAEFIGSSDKTYGRFSSHFNHGRADPNNNNPGTQRFQASSIGFRFTSQKMQSGMEDASAKFPGNGGTMLFHKLQDVPDQNGVPEGRLFMKFESVGMPDAFRDGNKKHGDLPEERLSTGQALNRCFHHGMNFVFPKISHSLAEKFAEPKHPAANRGEKLKSGVLDQDGYNTLMDRYATGQNGNPANLTADQIKAGMKGDYIVGSMKANLTAIRQHANQQDQATIDSINAAIDGLGETFGSSRSGSEIYTNSVDQLSNKTMADLF